MTNQSKDFSDIAQQARALAAKNERVDWDMVALNAVVLPLSLFQFGFDTTDRSKCKTEPMPDEWLQAVAGMPGISKTGLSHLAKALSQKGFVSVQDAVDFADIERREHGKNALKKINEKMKDTRPAGSALLLARLENELPGTIDQFLKDTKEVVKAVTGAAAFAAETSILVGRELGALANVLKNFRQG